MVNVFVVLNGKKLKMLIFVLISLFFAAGIVFSEKENIAVFSQRPEPQAVYSVVTNEKVLALTFDIAWGEKRPKPVIDTLKKLGVKKATFFLSAPWAKDHPDIVQDIINAGYEIGSNGYSHDNYSRLSDADIRKQINAAHQILSELTGKPPSLIRLPGGDFDRRVLAIANAMGYTVIQWDTDSLDWMNPGVQSIVNTVAAKAHPGDIVLLHADDGSRQTAEALPAIVDRLRKAGYRFATVSELLHNTKSSDREVRDHS